MQKTDKARTGQPSVGLDFHDDGLVFPFVLGVENILVQSSQAGKEGKINCG